MSAANVLSILRIPLRALGFVRQCGASRRSLGTMMALLAGKAGLDALSALLLAATLTALLALEQRSEGWHSHLKTFANEHLGGVVSPVLLLVVALVLCKGVMTPLLLALRGRLIDQWTLMVSVYVLEKELDTGVRQRPPVHAQGSNVAVNFIVPRILMGAILPSLDLLTEVIVVGVLLATLMALQPAATSMLILALLVAIGVGSLLSRKFIGRHGDLKIRLQTLMLRWVTDGVACLRELRLYQRVPAVLKRYRPVAKHFAKENARERTFMEVQSPTMELFFLLVLGAAVLVASAHSWQADLHALAIFSAVGLRLIAGFRRITTTLQAFKFVLPSLDYVTANRPSLAAKPLIEPAKALCDSKYLLVCESLCYRHIGAEQDVIRGLDFELVKGEWIALVGESGVGKSTFVDLLIGELQPCGGHIQWPASGGAHAGIGYASAVTTLIPGTLRDNVTLLGEQHSETELLEVLTTASIDSLLDRLPQGLDTPVELFEQRISSGERQRIGLARALLHAKSLLILDEATASLDQTTESRFLRGVRATRPDLAVLLITHRLSALRYTGRQLLMIDGKLQVFVPEPQSEPLMS